MKSLIPIFLCFSLTAVHGQNIWLKGYAGLGRESRLELIHQLDPNLSVNSSRSRSFFFAMPAVALEEQNGDFWELGFAWSKNKSSSDYSALRVPPSDSIQLVDLGATKFKLFQGQVEFNHRLRRKKENRIQTFFGFAISPYWSTFDFTPHQTYLYQINASLAGVNWGITPRIQIKWTKNLLFDLNAPLYILSSSYESTQIRNPALTVSQQKNSVFEVAFLKQIWLRAGLAWKIGGKKPAK